MIDQTKRCSMCQKFLPLSEFHKKGQDKLQPRCKACQSATIKAWYRKNKAQQSRNVQRGKKERIQRNQEFLMNYLKQHACIDCGEADPVVLEFDHVRGKKRNSVSRMVTQGLAIKSIQGEISKCEVRCANCHRRITSKRGEHYRSR